MERSRSSSGHPHLANRRAHDDGTGIGGRKKSKVNLTAMSQAHHGRDGPSKSHGQRKSTGDASYMQGSNAVTNGHTSHAGQMKRKGSSMTGLQHLAFEGFTALPPVAPQAAHQPAKKRTTSTSRSGQRSGRRKAVFSDDDNGDSEQAPVSTSSHTKASVDDLNDSWVSESETSATNTPQVSPKLAAGASSALPAVSALPPARDNEPENEPVKRETVVHEGWQAQSHPVDDQSDPHPDLYGVTPKATPEKQKTHRRVLSQSSNEDKLSSPSAPNKVSAEPKVSAEQQIVETPRPPSYLASPRTSPQSARKSKTESPDTHEVDTRNADNRSTRSSDNQPNANGKEADHLKYSPTRTQPSNTSSRSARSASASSRSARHSIGSDRHLAPLAAFHPRMKRQTTALAPKLDLGEGWGKHAIIESPAQEIYDPMNQADPEANASAHGHGHNRNMSNASMRSTTTIPSITATGTLHSDLTRRLREASAGGTIAAPSDRRRAVSGLSSAGSPRAAGNEGTGYFDSIRALARQSSSNLAGLVSHARADSEDHPPTESAHRPQPSTIYNALKKISPVALAGSGSSDSKQRKGKYNTPVIAKFTTIDKPGHLPSPTANRISTDRLHEHFSPLVSTPHTHPGSDEICSEYHSPGLLRPPLSQSFGSLNGDDFDENMDEDRRRREIQNWAWAIVFEAQRVAKVHEHARIWHDPVKDSFARIAAEKRRLRS